MAGVRKLPSGKYQGWFRNYQGQRQWFTLPGAEGRRRADVLKLAMSLEVDHHKMALGVLPLPGTDNPALARPLRSVMDEYLAWGHHHGGRKGRPWTPKHHQRQVGILDYWHAALMLTTLGQCTQILRAVERQVVQLQARHTGKTVAHYLQTLAAFLHWCVTRGYLDADPLRRLPRPDSSPRRLQRRAMTIDEVQRLLTASPPAHALLYETAILSGLRVGELRQLTLRHLDLDRLGLTLEAAWTKNRQPGFQPLPADLVARLSRFAAAHAPTALYQPGQQRRRHPVPLQPLLYVPTRTAATLRRDLTTAGIPVSTAAGLLDFHALRVTSINLLIAAGATVPEAQAHARHATPAMTIGVYGRAHASRLAALVNDVAGTLACASPEHGGGGDAHGTASFQAAGAGTQQVRRPRPAFPSLRSTPRLVPDVTRSQGPAHAALPPERDAATTLPLPPCAPDVHAALLMIVQAWPTLPAQTRQHILSLFPQE